MRHPLVVLAICAVPQFFLLGINFGAWELGSGEMDASHRLAAWQIFGMQVFSLAASLSLATGLLPGRRSFERWQGIIPLVGSLSFLAAVFVLAERAIPPAVADWMLPRDQWMIKQFALAMPAALFGALRLLCPNQESEGEKAVVFDRAISACLLLIVASIGYLFFAGAFMGLAQALGWGSVIPRILYALGFMALSTLAAASILRIAISTYVWLRISSPPGLAAMCVLVAILGPLLGLALNAVIPFPSDFQIPAIYAAALVNGAILVLPNFSHPVLHRAVWLAQCVMFPFTAYFFAVFLPFLLLGPMAFVLFGLGIFVYVPPVLFLLHGYRIIDGYRAEVRDGRRWLPAVLGLAAVAVWPAAYTIQARMDRASLHGALDYLQYPDYAENGHFGGSRGALKSSLEHLQDFKDGLYLPFLSEYYNWLAFDNLVLPQARINELSVTFFGEPTRKSVRRDAMAGFFGPGGRVARNVTEVLGGAQGERPSADGRLVSVKTVSRHEHGMTRALVELTVGNSTSTATEYFTTIRLSPGVMISGMYLTIGTERVPGRIFEKRAAMWVYQKITEARPVPRDPAILRHTGPGTVELRVYPVEANAPRIVEVEFLFPAGLRPDIELGGHGRLEMEESPAGGPFVGLAKTGEFSVTVPPSPAWPVVRREPYFHFLVDASKGSRFSDPAALRAAVRRIAGQFPEVSQARMTFVNFETRDVLGVQAMPLDELTAASDAELTPTTQGGLLAFRAIKEVLWQQQAALNAGDEAAFRGFPQIVLLRGTTAELLTDETGNLAEFARLLPDWPGYWVADAGHAQPARFCSLDPANPRMGRSSIHIFQAGGQRFTVESGGTASYVSVHPAKGSVDRLEAFDPGVGQFAPADVNIQRPDPAGYGKAVVPWSREMRRFFEPWRQKAASLGQLLAACRETGILVPSVAYMVVEDTAQWKMLERAEKKTMNGHEALALQESSVPEPGSLLLVCAAGIALLFVRNRRARAG